MFNKRAKLNRWGNIFNNEQLDALHALFSLPKQIPPSEKKLPLNSRPKQEKSPLSADHNRILFAMIEKPKENSMMTMDLYKKMKVADFLNKAHNPLGSGYPWYVEKIPAKNSYGIVCAVPHKFQKTKENIKAFLFNNFTKAEAYGFTPQLIKNFKRLLKKSKDSCYYSLLDEKIISQLFLLAVATNKKEKQEKEAEAKRLDQQKRKSEAEKKTEAARIARLSTKPERVLELGLFVKPLPPDVDFWDGQTRLLVTPSGGDDEYTVDANANPKSRNCMETLITACVGPRDKSKPSAVVTETEEMPYRRQCN